MVFSKPQSPLALIPQPHSQRYLLLSTGSKTSTDTLGTGCQILADFDRNNYKFFLNKKLNTRNKYQDD